MKTFEQFVNENKKFYGTERNDFMEDDNISVGGLIKKITEFQKGTHYCYLDDGTNTWSAEWEYKGIVKGKHLFIMIDDFGDESDVKTQWSDAELKDALKNKLFATQEG